MYVLQFVLLSVDVLHLGIHSSMLPYHHNLLINLFPLRLAELTGASTARHRVFFLHLQLAELTGASTTRQ
ncbi:hypothetical protein Ccrd_010999 [Cynara cardunculus var. scolymus]|uniref:Uncharacterized protein n=1 Tax=Cynara cardunculus var. scolymus TaxID=59895 RepID=A0A103YK55_CYNCS|nr:hypothetical protein Ccrd_010999 [Cynara cardunculus var. scolymus]